MVRLLSPEARRGRIAQMDRAGSKGLFGGAFQITEPETGF